MKEFYFAQKAFILSGEKLLVVQKSEDDPHNPGLWEVPGGRMDFGEDVDAHICREVKEEVGIDVKPGAPFYVWQWQLTRHRGDALVEMQIVAVARVCTALSQDIDVSGRVEDDYLGAVAWVPISELQDLEFIGNMAPVIEKFKEVMGRVSV